jgi:hypothetical protein
MDFRIEHEFDAAAGDVAAAMLDRSYQDSLGDLGPLSHRKVLEQSESSDGRVHRRTLSVLGVDLPGAARRVLGDSDPAWVEHAVWLPDRHRWEWTIEPKVAPEMLSAFGAIDLEGGRTKTRRTVTGSVLVRVPFIGGRVERWIIDGLSDAYSEEAVRLTAWLDKH